MSRTIGSLFAGLGGLELGLERAGVGRVIYQVEKREFCRGVLARHWPEAKRYGDVKLVKILPYADVMCGGFPCTDVSSAGRRRGLAGPNSGLWREFHRLVVACRPRAVVVENVASGATKWLSHVRHDLHDAGYRTRAYALSAADVGAPHLRRRIFVVGVAADAQRRPLRDEPRRGGRSRRQGAPEPRPHGERRPLAHADRARQPQSSGRQLAERRRLGDGGDAVADPVREGLEERGEQPARSERSPLERGGVAVYPGAVEPRVGRTVDGVPAGLDRLNAWGPGWESGVPRVARGVRDRTEKLVAFGNAVVPQCGQVIGMILAEELDRLEEAAA